MLKNVLTYIQETLLLKVITLKKNARYRLNKKKFVFNFNVIY